MKAITFYTLALAVAAAMLSVATAGEKHSEHATAKNADLAAILMHQAHQDANRGRLACPVWPDQAHDLPLWES